MNGPSCNDCRLPVSDLPRTQWGLIDCPATAHNALHSCGHGVHDGHHHCIGDKVQYICSSYDGSLIEEGTLHAGDLWARIHGYYLVMSLPDIPMYNVPANFVPFESFSSIDSLNYNS